MKDFSLGICQIQVTASKEENLARAYRQLKTVAMGGAQVAVLPEMFTSPYDQSYFTTFAEDTNGPAMKMLAQAAREFKIYVVGGSIPLLENSAIYNYSPVFNPQGRLIAGHRKIHLFDVNLPDIQFSESAILTPGRHITTFRTPFATFGLAICYDLRFPELARLMVDQGAEVLLYPAAFGTVTGQLHWDLNLRSRAVDNQVYLAGVGPAPNADLPYITYGHSRVYGPMGQAIKKLGLRPAAAVVPLSAQELKNTRARLPLLQHRRHDIYKVCELSTENN